MCTTNKLNKDEVYVYIAIRRVSPNKNENIGLSKKSYRLIRYYNQTEDEILNELNNIIHGQPGLWRIYRTVNKRSLKTAYQTMQIDMIEKYDSVINKVNSHWKSILMQSDSKCERNFLFDFDSSDNSLFDEFQKLLTEFGVKLIHKSTTPNGYHLITEPFYYHEFKYKYMTDDIKNVVERKYDALLFISASSIEEE